MQQKNMYMVAGVVLAVGVAFYGGMQYEKSTLASATPSAGSQR